MLLDHTHVGVKLLVDMPSDIIVEHTILISETHEHRAIGDLP
jgi:hypothetical protein